VIDRDEFEQVAAGVLATLDGAPPELLRAFAAGLELAGRPVCEFASAIEHLAVSFEYDEQECRLANLAMRRALRRCALEGSLIVRLAEARQPFWHAVGGALALVAEELLPAG
jgi:hypothetical protein